MELQERIEQCEKLLIGIGEEWSLKNDSGMNIAEGYRKLSLLAENHDYFIVTTVTDGEIYKHGFDHSRIVAPCGNENWKQCSQACSKDIWEDKEVPIGVCPHCGAPLIGNTIEAETYIEEGYLPQWQAYTQWLSNTLNKKLVVLELGVGFKTPTVIRWPFEKTVYLNNNSYLYRINNKFHQITSEISQKAEGISANSVEYTIKL